MKKPWSITTTLRNPERLRDFLFALKEINGKDWNSDTQKEFQILLIQRRKYGFQSDQFYKGLSENSDYKNKFSVPHRKVLNYPVGNDNEPIFTAPAGIPDLVLDPFLGSGTTAFVAKKLQRNWI